MHKDASECITIIIPVKNEEEGLDFTLRELHELGFNDVIVVDGHSTDNTVNVAKKYGALVVEQPGDGKADAVYYGLRMVKKPYVLLMDGDGTYDPSYIQAMLNKAINEDLDEVLGARTWGRENIPLINRFGNTILTSLFNMMFGTNLSDVLTGMYLLRTSIAKAIIPSTSGFSVEVDIASQVASMGKVGEIPIKYRRRIGDPKLRWMHGINIGIDMIKLMARFNPILILALLASLLVIPGIILTIYVASQLIVNHINHFIWGIIAFQLDTTGLLGILISLNTLMIKRMEYRVIRLFTKREAECTLE
ncbi:glycosyltransferase [Caldivirga sp. UBA161]|uniref:glycosyltransferase n=1 Tax=Caldivirga sp. UBA161 TaxID=1915569 RepID=UPI0025BE88AA|nr:glycosyltransferase [Caldivirga sp. UBA161]